MQLTYLYTKTNCAACLTAKILLNEQHEEYREVPIDNPLLEFGVQQAVGRVLAPVLIRPDGNVYLLANVGDGHKFVRIVGN